MKNIITVLKHNIKTTFKGWFSLILVLPIVVNLVATFAINKMNVTTRGGSSEVNILVYTQDKSDIIKRILPDEKIDSLIISDTKEEFLSQSKNENICANIIIDSKDIYTDIKENKSIFNIEYKHSNCDNNYITQILNTSINQIKTFGDSKEEYTQKYDQYKDEQYDFIYNENDLGDSMSYIQMFGLFSMVFLFIGIRCLNPIITEKETKIDKRILVSTITKVEYLLGHILGCFAVLLLQSITLLTTFYILNPSFNIDFIWMIIISFALSFVGLSIGLIILCISKNSTMYSIFASMIITPLCLFSGGFVPMEFMPSAIQDMSLISPLTWINSAFKKVVMGVENYNSIILDITSSISISIVFISIYLIIEKKKKNTLS